MPSFDWCLTYSHPFVEDKDGTVSVKMQCTTKDAEGKLMTRTDVEQQRVCGHQEARDFPGDCKIVTSPFVGDVGGGVVLTPENQLWQLSRNDECGNDGTRITLIGHRLLNSKFEQLAYSSGQVQCPSFGINVFPDFATTNIKQNTT